MKICLINNRYYPYQRGGAEVAVKEMKDALEKNSQQVIIITTKPEKTINKEESTSIYYLPATYHQLAERSFIYRFFWHINNLFNPQLSKKIIKILLKEKVDLVITHNLLGLGFQLPRLLKKANITHHHFLHDIQLLHPSGLMYYGKEKKINTIPSKIYQSINRKLFQSVSKVISPSNWLLEEHLQRGFFKKSQHSIEPFSSSNSYRIEYKLANKDKYFIFVGQLEKHKGVLLLIDAFKKIKEIDIKLLIIGTGKDKEKIKQEIGDNKKIELLGWKDKEELSILITNSLALIIPSLCYENSPTIINLAHSLNTLIIASNLGGIPEALNKEDIKFKPNNQEDLYNRLNEVLNKKD